MLYRMMGAPDASSYRGFADLARSQVRGKDYEILLYPRGSPVAVIAPHGGAIETRTSEIARAIAGNNFNLYLFEGIKPSDNYSSLHLNSYFFDEPKCLDLLARCQFVVAIHGCTGADERVLLGGLDVTLKSQIADALAEERVVVETTGHRFPATDPNNICNRGYSRQGAQLELTRALRDSASEALVVSAVRSVMVRANAAA